MIPKMVLLFPNGCLASEGPWLVASGFQWLSSSSHGFARYCGLSLEQEWVS
jgi:hypothetical protein